MFFEHRDHTYQSIVLRLEPQMINSFQAVSQVRQGIDNFLNNLGSNRLNLLLYRKVFNLLAFGFDQSQNQLARTVLKEFWSICRVRWSSNNRNKHSWSRNRLALLK